MESITTLKDTVYFSRGKITFRVDLLKDCVILTFHVLSSHWSKRSSYVRKEGNFIEHTYFVSK